MTRSPSPAKPAKARCCWSPALIALLLVLAAQQCSAAYYGKLIGKLSQLHHGVSGEVYAVDARTLFIKDFTYDGEGPAAFFYAGTTKTVGQNGFKVRDERGTMNVLKRYRKKDITLTLPEGKTLNNVKWFSVYCDEYAVNFGDVKIPRNFDYPRPQKLGSLSGIHGVGSEPVVVVDAQTLLVPSFSYDGEAPDAKFWVGAGPSPSPQGIRVPDENGKEVPLRKYDRKTIVLTLPADLTVHQLGHFGVWCEAFAVDFGHVQIPQSLNVPPSLKMLGVSPQSKLNCEILEDGLAFEVRWAVAGDSIVVQLVGRLEDNQYMSFGLSPDPKRSLMVGGDVVVAWVDKQTLQGYAIDYFLDAKSQCSGGRGSCPDVKIQENTNSVRLLNAAMVNGYSIVTYQRPLKASDELDQPVLTNGSQAVIWAVGPLNDKREVSFHSSYLKGDRFIEFGRPPAWNCPMPELQEPSAKPPQRSQQLNAVPDNTVHRDHRDQEGSSQHAATTRRPVRLPATPAPAPRNDVWEIPPIQCFEPEDGVFYAQMGPTGGKHGYPAITGHVGWGIAWYINGLLIPEIHVVRGKKYTFVVEGGDNPDAPARYHPFYITDDPVGGYQHKTPEERANVTILAGTVRQRGVVRPTGTGRLCNWVPDQNLPPADEFSSFGAYQRTLTLECDHGEPGIVTWVPDKNTPDTVYYQCFTHRYLGWKIHVHDACDPQQSSASEQHEVVVEPAPEFQQQAQDLEAGASIRSSPSKVTPSPEFFEHHQEYAPAEFDYPRGHHHHHHHHHHHAQMATNPPGKLITGPYHRDHQLQLNYHYDHYGYSHPQLTHAPSYNFEEQSRSPATKPSANFAHHRDNNNHNDHQQQRQHHRAPTALGLQESLANAESLEPDSPYSKLPDQHHVVRRPAALLANQVSAGPMRLSYPVPVHAPTSQNLVYARAQPPRMQAPPLVIYQRRPQFAFQPQLPRRSLVYQQQQQQQTAASSLLPVSRAPAFYERKKAVYKPPMLSRMQTLNKQAYHQSHYQHQPTKLLKVELKQQQQRAKAEAAIEALSSEQLLSLKPARNTGFDPGSIVIEKGFKPILKRQNQIDRSAELAPRDEEAREPPGTTERYSDSFEPVFVPSPPDRNSPKKQPKKKAQHGRTKLKPEDMEMAAAYPFEAARPKRQAPRSEDWRPGYTRDHDPDRHQDSAAHDHDHDRAGHDHHDRPRETHGDGHRQEETASTGEIILANIEYVVLTIVLYYAL